MGKRTTLEVRSRPLEIRAVEDQQKIVGYAAVFNEEVDIAGLFTEVIMPGAFSRVIAEGDDVRVLWGHDHTTVLGRTKNDTLSLREDDHGLWIECTPPDTQMGRDAVVSIARGDVDQMSIGFEVRDQDWNDKLRKRTLTDVKLWEVSPVAFPAYEGTSVDVRSAEVVWESHVQEGGGQEPEPDEDEQRRKQERAQAMLNRLDITKRKLT